MSAELKCPHCGKVMTVDVNVTPKSNLDDITPNRRISKYEHNQDTPPFPQSTMHLESEDPGLPKKPQWQESKENFTDPMPSSGDNITDPKTGLRILPNSPNYDIDTCIHFHDFDKFCDYVLANVDKQNELSRQGLCVNWVNWWYYSYNTYPQKRFTTVFDFIIKSWPEYSGDLDYPVGKRTFNLYYMRVDKTNMYSGSYGASRLRLLSYIRNSLIKYERLHHKYPRRMMPFIRHTFKHWNTWAIECNHMCKESDDQHVKQLPHFDQC